MGRLFVTRGDRHKNFKDLMQFCYEQNSTELDFAVYALLYKISMPPPPPLPHYHLNSSLMCLFQGVHAPGPLPNSYQAKSQQYCGPNGPTASIIYGI